MSRPKHYGTGTQYPWAGPNHKSSQAYESYGPDLSTAAKVSSVPLGLGTPYMTAKESADYLRLTHTWGKQTLIRLAREGKIRFGRIGRLYVFRKQDLDDYVYLSR